MADNRRNGSPKRRRGYHRAFTPQIAAAICRRVVSGRTLLSVCGGRGESGMGSRYSSPERAVLEVPTIDHEDR